MSVSHGVIKAILNGTQVENPILRISNLRSVLTEGVSKTRLILSDGETNHSYVVLSGQLNTRVNSGEIKTDSVIRLDNYVIKSSGGKIVIIIADLTVIHQQNIENLTPVAALICKPPVAQGIKRKATTSLATIPINLLNPYQNKWTIKGRVLSKNRIRTWSKASSEGKLFSFVIADDSCDLQVTAFNNEVDKFYDLIEVGKTYTISNAVVKVANQQYKCTKCEHDLSLKPDSEISEVDDDMNIPQIAHDFVDIAHIKDHSPKTVVDIIGVAHEVKDAMTIVSRTTNKEMLKRDIVLVDRTGCSIILTLWSEDVSTVDNLEHPVIVVRSAVVNDFGGRCLSVSGRSTMLINPGNISEARSLMGWYQDEGHSQQFESQSFGSGGFKSTKKVTIAELACTSDKGDYFTVEAVVANIKKDNLVYKSCEKCNKKVVDLNNGLYSCQKCNVETPDFKYRLMLNVNMLDHTGGVWVTSFQESAEKLIGKSSEEVGMMIDAGDKRDIEKMVSDVLYRGDYSVKLSVRNDTYNDETRLKVTLQEITRIDTADMLSALLAELSV